jgi:hypothetical protein
MDHRKVMDMPIRAFWVYARNVDRVRAKEQMAALDVAISAGTSEGYQQLREQLLATLGAVLVPDLVAIRDPDAASILRELAGQRIGDMVNRP